MTTRRMRPNHIGDSRLTRRTAVRAGVGLVAGATLGKRGLHAVAQDAATPIVLPDVAVPLPTGEVTLRWIDSGGIKADFFRPLFEEFQRRHSNIAVDYQVLPWPEISRVIPLGVQNRSAPDVFQLPPEITAAQAVAEGWIAPLSEVIPDLETWKAAFPPGIFLNGFTDFNGTTYTFPIHSNKRYSSLLFYNAPYFEQAGIDPQTPLTWDQFREAARKLTEQGNGEYFGLIIDGNQTNSFAINCGNLARMAGAAAGELTGTNYIDWRTGEFVFTAGEMVAAIELLLAIRDDGSIFPGSSSINAQEMRAQFPNGVAGMMLQGPWNVPQYRREAPDFAFGLASQPVPNGGEVTPLTVGPGAADSFFVYAESQLKAVAGTLLSYIGSEEGQIAYQTITKGATGVVFPAANELAGGDPLSLKALQIYDEQMRSGPDPRVRNPDTSLVYEAFRTPQPDLGQIIQGLYVGQLDDIAESLQDLQDRTSAELDRAIAAARERGAQISRDDFVFADWDPTVNYIEAAATSS